MSLGPAGAGTRMSFPRSEVVVGKERTYAPPEQSEPAITSSRPWTIVTGGEIPESVPGMSKSTFHELGLDVM